ncbi:MAG: YceI family protein [Bacteroidia bacterium]
MTNFKYFLGIASLSMLLVACGGAAEQKTENNDAATTTTENAAPANGAFAVDAENSIVEWKATKAVGGHNGTVKFDASSVNVENGNLTGGKFTINMGSIKVLDLKDSAQSVDLAGHLQAPDFFDAPKFPTATFELTKAEAVKDNPEVTHNLSGKFTIRGISKDITAPAKVSFNGKEMAATSILKFNRQDYGIVYHSAKDKSFDLKKMGDKLINDEVELKLNVKAKVN